MHWNYRPAPAHPTEKEMDSFHQTKVAGLSPPYGTSVPPIAPNLGSKHGESVRISAVNLDCQKQLAAQTGEPGQR